MHLWLSRACSAAANHISLSPSAAKLDLIIARATTPDDLPLDDRFAWELIASITASPLSSTTFPLSFARRFRHTRSPRTALKCLLLLHRLLRLLPGNHPFHAHLVAARDNSLLSLHPPGHFHNNLFLHYYAILLDELMTWHADVEEDTVDVAHLLGQLPRLQRQLDRAMSCRQAVAVGRCDLVQSVMKQIVRESFVCYAAIKKSLEVILDGLLQLPYPSCIVGIELYGYAGRQAGQLVEFYDWSRRAGICRMYEYPTVERIPEIQIRALRSFVERMWQLTGDASSTSTSPSTTSSSSSSTSALTVTERWEKFEEIKLKEQEEEKPFIKIDVDEVENNWEVLLEGSVDPRHPYSTPCSFTSSEANNELLLHYCKRDGRIVQTYKRSPINPFFDQIEEKSSIPSS